MKERHELSKLLMLHDLLPEETFIEKALSGKHKKECLKNRSLT